jgi:hypothetical protein
MRRLTGIFTASTEEFDMPEMRLSDAEANLIRLFRNGRFAQNKATSVGNKFMLVSESHYDTLIAERDQLLNVVKTKDALIQKNALAAQVLRAM